MLEHNINNTNRQTTKNVVKPLLKPHEQEFMRVVLQIEQTANIPDRSIVIGDSELDTTLNVLIEGLIEGGLDGYHATKKALLKTNQRLMRIFSAGATLAPEQEKQDAHKITLPNGKTAFKTFNVSDLRKLPRAKWLVPGMLQKQAISLLYGDANTGKTFMALDIAMHIVYGDDWLGRTIQAPGRVLYIYGEGSTGLLDRVDAWLKYHSKSEEPNNIDFIPFPVQFLSDREELANTIDALDTVPELIVFDTFSMCAEGIPENDNAEVAKCLSAASFFKHQYGSHVMVIHHVGKNGKYRGAASFKGNVDTMICLSAEEGGQGEPIKLECEKQRDHAHFEPFYIRLERIELGEDPDTLEFLSSCVVVAGGAVKEEWKEQADSEQKLMLSILASNPTVGANKWQKLCEDADLPVRAFRNHKKFMLGKGIIKEIAPERRGLSTTYKIDPAYAPAQEIAQGGQEGA